MLAPREEGRAQGHTLGVKGWGRDRASCSVLPLIDPCLLLPLLREVLGLVDMVALENGELGPLLSPGTVRGLEDECVTDVKVWGIQEGGGHSAEREGSHWAWGPLLSPF